MKTVSDIRKLIGGIYRHGQHGDCISLLLFFEGIESGIKKTTCIHTPSGFRRVSSAS
jgi:hypothetical protein